MNIGESHKIFLARCSQRWGNSQKYVMFGMSQYEDDGCGSKERGETV